MPDITPEEFLRQVWAGGTGYACLGIKRAGQQGLRHEWFRYPAELNALGHRVRELVRDHDLYYAPALFSERRATKKAIAHVQAAWVDADDAWSSAAAAALKPSYLFKTSPNRAQAIFLSRRPERPAIVERANQRLTQLAAADKSGVNANKLLRLPGTLNHKHDPPWRVRVRGRGERHSAAAIAKLELSDRVPLSDCAAFRPLPGWIKDLTFGYDRNGRLIKEETHDRSGEFWKLLHGLKDDGVERTDALVIARFACDQWIARFSDDQIETQVAKVWGSLDTRESIQLKSEPVDEFLQRRAASMRWLVKGVVMEGALGFIAGEPKSFKSLTAYDLALSVASGTPFLGRFPVTRKARVLLIHQEDRDQLVQANITKIMGAKSLWGRIHNVHKRHGKPAILEATFFQRPDLHLLVNRGVTIVDAASVKSLRKEIGRLRPDLVIIDTTMSVMGNVDTRQNQLLNSYLVELRKIRNDFGCAILMVHHFGKSSEGKAGGKRLLDGTAYHAWTENSLYYERSGKPRGIRVEREVKGAGLLEPYYFELSDDDDSYEVRVIDTPPDTAEAKDAERALEFIRPRGEMGATINDLRQGLGGSKPKWGEVCRALAAQGRLIRSRAPRGKGTYPVWRAAEDVEQRPVPVTDHFHPISGQWAAPHRGAPFTTSEWGLHRHERHTVRRSGKPLRCARRRVIPRRPRRVQDRSPLGHCRANRSSAPRERFSAIWTDAVARDRWLVALVCSEAPDVVQWTRKVNFLILAPVRRIRVVLSWPA